MKIDYVVISSDDNPMYKDFYEVVSKKWNEFGLKTYFINITNENEIIHNEYGIIHKIKAVDGVPSSYQSQIVRLFCANLVEGNLLMSDIDMIPLNKNYYQNEEINENDFIIYSSDWEDVNNIPMCYVAGYGHVFDLIFETNCSFSSFVNTLHKRGHGWGGDQEYLSHKILNYNKNKKVNFKKWHN